MNRLTSTLTAGLLLLAGTSVLPAQTPSAAPLAPPVLPLIVTYHYWPIQFVQWPSSDLPYSMVLLNVDPRPKQPVLDLTLVDRTTNKRIHYTNSDAVVSAVQAVGEEVHKTAIAYDPPDNDNNGSVTSLRFTMADGKPFQWRFVQGSDMSEQGSGLTAMPGAKIPIFAYRELGALAGEGTALQVGEISSAAEVWTEYTHAPYFIAYHGAETEGAHTLIFAPDQQTWKVTSSPASLTAGATWELDEQHGNHRTIRIDKLDGAHLIATCTERLQPGVQYTLDATRTGDTWAINSVRFAPLHEADKHSLTLDFKTPLSAAAASTAFTLVAGRKTELAAGSLTGTSTASDGALTLTFTDPKWLNGVTMQEGIASTPTGITLTAHP